METTILINKIMQHVDGVKVRMTRRKFRDFLHDRIGISSQVIADRIFVYFNKATLKERPLNDIWGHANF